MSLYIGLMSGTSMDGVDVSLVKIDDRNIEVIRSSTIAYPHELRTQLAHAIAPATRLSLHEFGSLNISIGRVFAQAAHEILDQTNTHHSDVDAIGSHGQTLRHSPDSDPPYSIQLGDPATIATRTLITTVADFRALDIAAGGQGAPLVPAFHDAWFREDSKNTVVVNIGGIANITVLSSQTSAAITGYDTGPGNCLLDEWIADVCQRPFDKDGNWAASGNVHAGLLAQLIADPYIQRTEPKSTGREYFNLEFLKQIIQETGTCDLPKEDVQATLLEFTVASIARAIEESCAHPDDVFVCGGGVNNAAMMSRLREFLPASRLSSTAMRDIDPDAIEAVAFAWLARQRLNLESVPVTTGPGATARILGAVYVPKK
jgi:anhydro-N-acetylmuramic acid kinase